MVRSIGIVLVIWGLIVQPLMAAVPVTVTDDATRSTMPSDSGAMGHARGHHATQDAGRPSEAPCHEKVTDDAASESCDSCGIDCMNGICASSCVIGGAAVFHRSAVNLDLPGSSSVAAISRARTYGLPSRIFHPPKHA